MSEANYDISSHKWAETLHEFLELAGKAVRDFNYERALSYLTTMEEVWEQKGLPTYSPELRCDLYNEKGKVLARLGRIPEAIAEYQKLLTFCQEQNLSDRKVEIFLEIGQLLIKTGEMDSALGYVHRALSGYRRQKNPMGLCRSLRNLGVIYFELGEFDDAEAACEEAIEIAQGEGLGLLYADIYNNLGTVKNVRGDWKGALECYIRAQAVYDKEGEIRKSAYALNNIGITLLEQDRSDNAREYFLSALKTAAAVKDESLCLILNINLTDLWTRTGDYAEAEKYNRSALTYLETNNLRNSQLAEARKQAGKIACSRGNHAAALGHFDEALKISRNLGLQYIEAEIMFERGNLYLMTEAHMEALASLESAYRLYNQFKAAGRLKKTEGLIGSVEELYLKVFEAMADKVDRKDPYTKGHSDRVANLSLCLAQNLGLPDPVIKTIVAGALLHDLGKLDIPDEILNKKGRLTKEEFDEVKNHPDYGVRLLAGINLPWEVIPLIRHHHEHYDGTGYPSGLSGELIPTGARVVCVADVFDALTSERPYRDAFSAEKAIQVMCEEMAGTFDPAILDNFIALIKSGRVDDIVNRHTDRDEMYKIWAQCRVKTEEAVAS